MVITAETGSRIAACRDRDSGSVSNLFGRNMVEINARMRLEKPDTNISWEVEMFILLHCAPTTFATAPAAAA